MFASSNSTTLQYGHSKAGCSRSAVQQVDGAQSGIDGIAAACAASWETRSPRAAEEAGAHCRSALRPQLSVQRRQFPVARRHREQGRIDRADLQVLQHEGERLLLRAPDHGSRHLDDDPLPGRPGEAGEPVAGGRPARYPVFRHRQAGQRLLAQLLPFRGRVGQAEVVLRCSCFDRAPASLAEQKLNRLAAPLVEDHGDDLLA